MSDSTPYSAVKFNGDFLTNLSEFNLPGIDNIETNFDVYKYWLKGSPNGAKWLVTVDCSENGYKLTYEKY